MSDYVECPYCGKEVEITWDDYEGEQEADVECPHCEKEFELHVDYEPYFSADTIEYKKCIECGKTFRYTGKSFPMPSKYEHLSLDEYILCKECYIREAIRDLEQQEPI